MDLSLGSSELPRQRPCLLPFLLEGLISLFLFVGFFFLR